MKLHKKIWGAIAAGVFVASNAMAAELTVYTAVEAEDLKRYADTFNKEDIAIVESVQRGLSSLGYDQSRYVADEAESWFSESALHRFHKQILEALTQRGDFD